jgi:hypothetical protein
MPESDFRIGDCFGCYCLDDPLLSAAVNAFTWGWPLPWPAKWTGLSHVAVIGMHPHACGETAVWESTTGSKLPCLLRGYPVDGVQAHGVAEWLAAYKGFVWHYPLTADARQWFDEEAAQAFLWGAAGKPYDYRQAWNSRSTTLGRVARKLYRGAADAAYYCSELDAGYYRDGFSFTPRLWNPKDLQWNPNRLMRKTVRLGIHERRSRVQ